MHILKSAVAAVLAVGLVAMLSGCATMAPDPSVAAQSDPGYFLSLKQKGQLIWTGRIQDGAGRWYDVWIVPGYVPPARRTREYLRKTGSDFAEYVHREKYRALAHHSKDAFNWAYDDVLTDFTVNGVPRAWRRYFSSASQRSSRRVFGWWFAYPWALMEGTVDTVVRVPVGLTGTILGTAWGGVVVPGYYAVNSTVKGTWHFAADAVVFPTVGCAWNTVIAPPLALVGQKPSPARVDGFWVTQVGAEETQAAVPVSSNDVEALAQWGRYLLTTIGPYDERRRDLQKQTQAEREALNQKARQAEAALAAQEQESIRAIGNDPARQQVIDYLRTRGISLWTYKAVPEVQRRLEAQGDLSPADVSRIMNLLSRYPPSPATMPPLRPSVRPKTDPVQNSIEVIKEIH